MAEAYIVATARTAGGRKGGRLAGWHPADLAASVLDSLVERLAGVLALSGADEKNKERTLYCFHRLPLDPRQNALHTAALNLVGERLETLRRQKDGQWEDMPHFVFLLLNKTSKLEGLRASIVSMLRTRFKHERNRAGHGPSA